MIIYTECPSCGHQEFDPDKQCACGYYADESFNMESGETKNEATRGKLMKHANKSKIHASTEELFMKEIDSWVFSFSRPDNCIYLGTPALQTFRLRITLDDLEELLEIMYQKTGEGKLLLSLDDIPALIRTVNRIIEEKRSKVELEFSGDELTEVIDLINTKLKQ